MLALEMKVQQEVKGQPVVQTGMDTASDESTARSLRDRTLALRQTNGSGIDNARPGLGIQRDQRVILTENAKNGGRR